MHFDVHARHRTASKILGDDEGLPYLEAIVTPKAEDPEVFEVLHMGRSEGAAQYGDEVPAEGELRFVFEL